MEANDAWIPDPMEKLVDNLRQTVSQAQIRSTTLPLCPEISLYLLAEDYPRGRLPVDEMLAILDQPAYWAFCWASGQVLARYILDHPQRFAGTTVLDFGAGSGVVGIAASLAGAERVIACDIDPFALDACQENARLNGVVVELLGDIEQLSTGVAAGLDWIIAADVLYDRENYPWIKKLPSMASHILIADSRVGREKLSPYKILDQRTASTVPDLDEFREFGRVRVYEALVGSSG